MNFPRLILAFSFCLIFASFASAQQQATLRISKKDSGENRLNELFVEFEEAAEKRLQRRISLLKDSCDLTEQQVRKLDVACLGAASQFVEGKRDLELPRLRHYQKKAGFEFDENDNPIEDNRQIRNRTVVFTLKFPSPNLVEDSEIWQRAVTKVLDENQLRINAEIGEARQTRLRNAAINAFVARVDFHMNMRGNQIKELCARISDDPVADQLAQKLLYQELALTFSPLRHKKVEELEFHYLVDSILNEHQLKKWDRYFEPELQNLSRDIQKLEAIFAPPEKQQVD